jgi:serine/threonine-protein kinase
MSGFEQDGPMEPGTVLAGRYVVGRRIGAGGMGQVHAGVDRVLQRDVAIKTCPLGRDDTVALERFRREARAAASLGHRNVVTIHDAGAEARVAFIVMELLPGPDLATYVSERGPLPEREAVAIASQVAAGLAAAHAAGVVHRDIKPANIVFDSVGAARIVDFGIARLEQVSGLTTADTVIGSAHYLSPEQISGEPADARADLYSLGCVLVTMLTGRPPFEAEHAMGVAHQHLSAEPPRLSDIRPEVSPSLAALVRDLLAKSPSDRPASAGDVVQRLAALGSQAAGEGTVTTLLPSAPATSVLPSTPPTTVLPVAAGQAPVAAARRDGSQPPPFPGGPRPPATRASTRSRRARRRPNALLAAAVALALVAVVGWALLGGSGGETPPIAGGPSSAPTSSTQPSRTSSPARSSSAPSATQEQPVAEQGSTAAVDALRRAIEAATSVGALEGKAAEDLQRRLDDVSRQLARGNQDQVQKKLDDLDKEVEDLAKKGELSPAGYRLVRAALDALKSSL